MQTALWKSTATISISVAITEYSVLKLIVVVFSCFYTFISYRGKVCFVFVENSTDDNFRCVLAYLAVHFISHRLRVPSKCYMLGLLGDIVFYSYK